MSQKTGTNNETIGIVVLVIAAIVVSGLLGYYLSTIGNSISSTSKQAQTSNTVNLDIIPDYGGSGYDAFVLASALGSGIVPTPATNLTGPGANDNNITVSSGSTVTFVVTSIDTAVNQNFTGQISTPFTVYNDTSSGVISSQYSKGQTVASMQMGHTFTIQSLGVNVPIPPDIVIKFAITFSKPGTYLYLCLAPCGPGMGIDGYMNGYIIVK